jgi:outer membrane biosynthesis protein TonB
MTRFLLAVLVVLALALRPVIAGAQSEMLLDDAQRTAIEDYFKAQAEQARKAQQAKPTNKTKGAAKPVAKTKKPEKPKKPVKPKTAQKDKNKDKTKSKAKGKTDAKANIKNGDKTKPPTAPPAVKLERDQVLAPDLPRRALPKDLDSQLGRPARGTQRVIVGDDVVLFERKTGRILDIMEDAVKGGTVGR